MSQASIKLINQQENHPESPSTKPASISDPPARSSPSAAASKRSLTPSVKPVSESEEDKDNSDTESLDQTVIRDRIIDMEIFQQILDLDEDGDDRDFSKGMVYAYFEQAEDTFKTMDTALLGKKLEELSDLGHFLKGSSAALGVWRVQASCERIQHYGQRRDEEANKDLSREEALEKITRLLPQVKEDYVSAEEWLKNYYTPPPTSKPTLEASAQA